MESRAAKTEPGDTRDERAKDGAASVAARHTVELVLISGHDGVFLGRIAFPDVERGDPYAEASTGFQCISTQVTLQSSPQRRRQPSTEIS